MNVTKLFLLTVISGGSKHDIMVIVMLVVFNACWTVKIYLWNVMNEGYFVHIFTAIKYISIVESGFIIIVTDDFSNSINPFNYGILYYANIK